MMILLKTTFNLVKEMTPALKPMEERRHIAFLKVHKTGSSSVQNIFLRFGDLRNLTFILAHDAKDKSESSFPNVISYKRTLLENNIVSPPPGRNYDLMCCHVVFNKTQFAKFLPQDTVYIAVVRHPIKRLESAIRYFRMFKAVDLHTLAVNPFLYDRQLPSMANNRMAFEFGFPLHLFPRSINDYNKSNIAEEISENLQVVKYTFDLILVNEFMDESLILMKRLLGWHVKDIIYQKKLVAESEEVRRFQESDTDRLAAFLHLDFLLYQMAVKEVMKKIEKAENGFQGEVDHFKHIVQEVTYLCNNKSKNARTFAQTRWDSAFEITQKDCKLYMRDEIPFIQDIRQKMYGKINI